MNTYTKQKIKEFREKFGKVEMANAWDYSELFNFEDLREFKDLESFLSEALEGAYEEGKKEGLLEAIELYKPILKLAERYHNNETPSKKEMKQAKKSIRILERAVNKGGTK